MSLCDLHASRHQHSRVYLHPLSPPLSLSAAHGVRCLPAADTVVGDIPAPRSPSIRLRSPGCRSVFPSHGVATSGGQKSSTVYCDDGSPGVEKESWDVRTVRSPEVMRRDELPCTRVPVPFGHSRVAMTPNVPQVLECLLMNRFCSSRHRRR